MAMLEYFFFVSLSTLVKVPASAVSKHSNFPAGVGNSEDPKSSVR